MSSSHRELEAFATLPEDFVLIASRDVTKELGKPIHRLKRQDRVYFVQKLDKAEVFNFQAVDIISQEIGIFRSSLYNYLKDIRSV